MIYYDDYFSSIFRNQRIAEAPTAGPSYAYDLDHSRTLTRSLSEKCRGACMIKVYRIFRAERIERDLRADRADFRPAAVLVLQRRSWRIRSKCRSRVTPRALTQISSLARWHRRIDLWSAARVGRVARSRALGACAPGARHSATLTTSRRVWSRPLQRCRRPVRKDTGLHREICTECFEPLCLCFPAVGTPPSARRIGPGSVCAACADGPVLRRCRETRIPSGSVSKRRGVRRIPLGVASGTAEFPGRKTREKAGVAQAEVTERLAKHATSTI
jgi:hypothetical protein